MGAVKNSGIGRMLRIDCGRAFLSGRFAVSVIMGVTVCYFAMLFCGYHSPAVHIFVYMHSKSIVFLALIAGVLPYSACFYAGISAMCWGAQIWGNMFFPNLWRQWLPRWRRFCWEN